MQRLSAAVASLPIVAAAVMVPALVSSGVAANAAPAAPAPASTTVTTPATTSAAPTDTASPTGTATSSDAATPTPTETATATAQPTTAPPATSSSASTTPRPAPTSAPSTAANECTPTVAFAQTGHGTWWDPISIKIDGSFADGCTVSPGSKATLKAHAPAGVTFQPASYPFTGGVMTVTETGVVTFTFDETFSTTRPLSRVFGGTLLMHFDSEIVAPGQELTITWTGSATATLPVAVPTCPDCAELPKIDLKWAKVLPAPKGQGYNEVLSGIITKPIPADGAKVVITDTLDGAQKCVGATLFEITGRDERGRDISTPLMPVACADAGTVTVTVPADKVVKGHAYQLLVIAHTTGYQAEGYTDKGSVVIGTRTDPVTAHAKFTTGSAYGDGSSPAPTAPATTAPATDTPTVAPTATDAPTTPAPATTPTTAAPKPTATTPAPAQAPAEEGALPYTGAAIAGTLGLGGVLTAGGFALIVAGKRRNAPVGRHRA